MKEIPELGKVGSFPRDSFPTVSSMLTCESGL